MLQNKFFSTNWSLIMITKNNKIENTESDNVEDSRPSKRNITVTMVFAVLLAFAFIALGMWWFTN